MTAQAVEIVVPVYNALHDLRACVESVLAHTQGPYSLVLIDDASSDLQRANYRSSRCCATSAIWASPAPPTAA